MYAAPAPSKLPPNSRPVQLQLGWLQRNGQVPGMEGSTGQFQRKGGSPAPAWLAAEKWPSTRDGGEYRAISEERWKKECSRRGTGGAGQGRAGWLQLQLQVPEKNKEKVERYPERRSSQTRVATTCLADKTNHPVERLSLNRSQCGSCSTKYDTSAGT